MSTERDKVIAFDEIMCFLDSRGVVFNPGDSFSAVTKSGAMVTIQMPMLGNENSNDAS